LGKLIYGDPLKEVKVKKVFVDMFSHPDQTQPCALDNISYLYTLYIPVPFSDYQIFH